MKTKAKNKPAPSVFGWAKKNVTFKPGTVPIKSKRLIALEKKRHKWEMKYRGTGRTTYQMKTARRNAIYVWCNTMLHYPIALARMLERRDLTIVSPSWLRHENVLGHGKPIVIDHHTELDGEQYRLIQYNRERYHFSPAGLQEQALKDWNAGNCEVK